ncbi:hypothetical protein ACJIZ3_004325 [Penstemon smallii]|uniref:FAS1 domain-containing protein n=1 Tax=Penstemon smallii TaxID=265156 RepID=A0ABD3S1T6_9LAMI
MSTPSTTLILLSALILLSTAATTAHNITRILEEYPDFGEFNSLLTQTKLAEEINRRVTITVLAVANGGLGDINGKAKDVQRRILSNHVVLDYYDQIKLDNLKGNTTVLTTLFQSTGMADHQMGFLNVVHNKDKSISFGSAVRGAAIDATYLNSVAKMPYNISVLRISHLIVAPGIDRPMAPTHAPAPERITPNNNDDDDIDIVPPPLEADGPVGAPTADKKGNGAAGKLLQQYVFGVALASFLLAASVI